MKMRIFLSSADTVAIFCVGFRDFFERFLEFVLKDWVREEPELFDFTLRERKDMLTTLQKCKRTVGESLTSFVIGL
ncbi:hypothetical protein VIBNIAM115_1210106 [Vibrio nigripulchritudo AM115]|nr:hypothetical protein VIBNIAM115_1210106 [Vibrio nigripulchritudo AM115]